MDSETGVGDAAGARHLGGLRCRLTVAAILTIPILGGLAQMTVAPWLPAILSEPLFQLALATPVQFWPAGRSTPPPGTRSAIARPT